ncbi:hypothetical protein Nepgr_018282 [Nepenthes gracilis]|uniref:Sodium transporter HKT1 n=1 Tax=Nepenthes gracilis TaxID=150966 RepID=A0AAD3XU59_NEPGR|nr:hypothetical protein Nepgr_018282 [Nepenthes gracilis]
MAKFSSLHRKTQNLCSCFVGSIRCVASASYNFVFFHVNSFTVQLLYFLLVSLFGFFVLKALKPRTAATFRPASLDLFFTSVSAATVSSMSTVEMEVFSNAQLLVMTVLMLVGGEVFTSMVGLNFESSKLLTPWKTEGNSSPLRGIEMAIVATPELQKTQSEIDLEAQRFLNHSAVKLLGLLVATYFFALNLGGVALVIWYMSAVPSARDVLEKKGLKTITFALFTVVSSFSNCGFVPTNENMIVFRKNSGLLLLILPQLLLGNTLFPPVLRLLVWALGKFVRRSEFDYLLNNTREIGYLHLLPAAHSLLLAATVFAFTVVQMVLFCSMEWNSEALSGMNGFQKFVGSLFQVVNSRHAGESIVNLSVIAPAVLTLFVVMMYLPPYTSFLPAKYAAEESSAGGQKTRGRQILENVLFSQLGYLVIFVIAICITERKSLIEDPLNFNVLNIVIEVVSAYGNVGFSTGYSCESRLNQEGSCVDKWYGFAGKWSGQGKIILIVVMFFGRLKKFNMNGGRAWKLQ